MKKYIVVMILFFSLFFCLSVSAKENYIKMTNGDYSISGFGSVSEELKQYDIDVFSYQLGTKENKALMIAEGEQNIYLYIYDKNGYNEYDRVSLSSYYGDSSNRPTLDSKDLIWKELTIKLVSYDSTLKLQKYLIEGLTYLENEYHSIYIRQIYNEKNKENRAYVFGIGFVYQYNPLTKESKIDTEETIVVKDKRVAYEVYPQEENGRDYIWQKNYVAFSTDKKMEDLFEVRLKYNGFDYSAYTDIELNFKSNTWDLKAGVQEFSKALTNKNVYRHVDKNRYFEIGTKYQDKHVSIKNEEIDLTYSNGFWWSKKKGNWKYNTIESTEILKERKTSLSDQSILNYDYVVSFDNRKVDCFTFISMIYKLVYVDYSSVGGISVGVLSKKNSLDYVYNPFGELNKYFTKEDITTQVIKDNVKPTENRMLEVEDLTLLEFHYMDNGQVKSAIAVDSYNDTEGGKQFTDNQLTSWFENFLKDLKSFFKSDVVKIFFRVIVCIIIALILVVIMLKIKTARSLSKIAKRKP